MSVDTEAMGLLVLPEALVKVAIGVDQTAVSVDRVVQHVPFVQATVRPDHKAWAVSLFTEPVAFVALARSKFCAGLGLDF